MWRPIKNVLLIVSIDLFLHARPTGPKKGTRPVCTADVSPFDEPPRGRFLAHGCEHPCSTLSRFSFKFTHDPQVNIPVRTIFSNLGIIGFSKLLWRFSLFYFFFFYEVIFELLTFLISYKHVIHASHFSFIYLFISFFESQIINIYSYIIYMNIIHIQYNIYIISKMCNSYVSHKDTLKSLKFFW